MGFVLAVDGFGPFHGWLMFAAVMFAVIVIGGALGMVGRQADLRKRDQVPAGDSSQGR
jgi:hypothetical protein